MARYDRYAYMADPRHNPPNEDCPECPEASKTHFIGSKTLSRDGKLLKSTRYECEHKHAWIIEEERE